MKIYPILLWGIEWSIAGVVAFAWTTSTKPSNTVQVSIRPLVVVAESIPPCFDSYPTTDDANNNIHTTMIVPLPNMKTNRPMPIPALPPPICSNVPGTWAYDTMSRRVRDEILHRTALDHPQLLLGNNFVHKDTETDTDTDMTTEPQVVKEWCRSSREAFLTLRNELAHAADTPLSLLNETTTTTDDEEPERERHNIELHEWNDIILQPLVDANETWLSAPWMVSEFYLYRRLMQAIGYFDLGSPGFGFDLFAKQKRAGLVSSVGNAEPMLEKMMAFLLKTEKEKDWIRNGLGIAVGFALWGNKMDLSLWPASTSMTESHNVDVFTEILDAAGENLLHDDSDLLIAHCQALHAKEGGGGRIHLIVDNAGFELVTDLTLATFLIQSKIASTVVFELKSHPTFVSDALVHDLEETVDYYRHLDATMYPNAKAAGETWDQYLKEGRFTLHPHRFWVQPFAMWDMTEPLRTTLAQNCDLAIVKGDANYRRLLGDRTWNFATSFQSIVGAYFPCPVLALRTLKAEIGCGMDPAQTQRAHALDTHWLVNGRFGVIHFGSGAAVK